MNNATTDSSGRFVIEGVPLGPYALDVIHPLLDTLGISLKTPELEAKLNDSSLVVMSVPSPKTIAERKCSPQERQRGAAMAIGTVFDAETEAASAGAHVYVEWTDYELGGKTLNRSPQVRSSTVGIDGHFQICGIPTDLVTGIAATRGNDSTALLRADFGAGLVIASFHLSPVVASPSSISPANTAVVQGQVTDPRGSALQGARVSLENDSLAAITNVDGHYKLVGLRGGTRALMVRRLGYEPVTLPVEVRQTTPVELNVRMTKFVPVLETVRVSALREIGLERIGFTSRKRTGMGKYITPEQIQGRNSPRLVDLLATVPSLRAGRTDDGRRYVTGRHGDCVRYYVDGRLWADISAGPDEFLAGGEIGAIEVYDSLFAPAEFMAFGRSGAPCAIVVVWTRWKLRI